MADRPGNGGPEDGTNYGWLYGAKGGQEPPPDATRAIPRQQRPAQEPTRRAQHRDDETRVMPTQQPSGGATPRSPVPAPAPTPPQHGGGGSGGSSRFRRPRFWFRMVALLLALWLVYTIAVPFFAWNSTDKVTFAPDGDRPGDQPGTTYLLVGSDSRKGLTAAERKKFSTGNPKSELTDTIMLLHTGDGPDVLLSIPRDSIVDMPGHGSSKINSAYARGGAQLLVQTIEGETGIRIDEYVEIGLGGVAGVVDSVGGIEVCPKQRINDKLAGLRIKKGCQEVDGKVALAYSRSRKQSPLGDLERVQRQREVVAAIGDKVLSPWSVVNPVRWWRLNNAVPGFFGFGEDTSTLDAGRWALAMTKVGGKDGRTCTMPVTDGSANNWDRDRAEPIFRAFIEDSTDDITKAQCTPSGLPGNR
ncbi:LCP family protein [Nocardioides lijunqiniae]|uniref:LCP family protein n=1 Tax=Nocardioides lijunqiniae TaxID=2760832 RepID=UPI0018775602|nr:LCP family protein [Nocardioides lijunqiniae]